MVATAVRPSTSKKSLLLAELERREEHIRVKQRCLEQDRLDIALELHAIESRGLREAASYSSITAYARQRFGYPSGMTTDYRNVGRACEAHPRILELMRGDRIRWCVGRELARAVINEPGRAGELIEKAQRLTFEDFRAEVNGGKRLHRIVLELDDQELADFEDALASVRADLGPVERKVALVEVCRRECARKDVKGRARPMFVIQACPSCGCATRETSAGPVAARPEDVQHAMDEGDVVDLRTGTGEVTRYVPADVRRGVEARDRFRCLFPGCKSRRTDLHHEDGVEKGHHPKRMGSLCDAHHDQRHKGIFRIEGDMPGARFYLHDGTYLGQGGDPMRADIRAASGEALSRESTPTGCQGELSRESTAEQEIDLAVRAVHKMGIPERDARAWVRRMIAGDAGRAWTANDIVLELLRASPAWRGAG